MIFYRSFFEAIDELEPLIQVSIYKAIFEYSMNGNEVILDGVAKTVWKLIKPQLDANLQRFENGKKGGRRKQSETETKPKDNQNETKSEANNNNNNNVNNNKNNNKIEYMSSVFLTEIEFVKLSELFEDKTNHAIEILSNYKLSSGKKYKSDYHALIGWVKEKMQKENFAPKEKSKIQETLEMAASSKLKIQSMFSGQNYPQSNGNAAKFNENTNNIQTP